MSLVASHRRCGGFFPWFWVIFAGDFPFAILRVLVTLLFGKVSLKTVTLWKVKMWPPTRAYQKVTNGRSWLRACSLGLHSLKRTANLPWRWMKYLRLQLLWLKETHVSANWLVLGRVFGFGLFLQVQFHCIFLDHSGPSMLNQGPHDGELRRIGRPTVCRKMVVLICSDHHKYSFSMDNATMYSTKKLNSVHLPKCKPFFSFRNKNWTSTRWASRSYKWS